MEQKPDTTGTLAYLILVHGGIFSHPHPLFTVFPSQPTEGVNSGTFPWPQLVLSQHCSSCLPTPLLLLTLQNSQKNLVFWGVFKKHMIHIT